MGDTQTIGTCYGFAVRSSLPFHYLRGGEGEPLHVSAPSHVPNGDKGNLVIEWKPTPAVPFEAALYQQGHRFLLKTGRTGWFVIDPEQQFITLPADGDVVLREERLWHLPAILCFLARGDLPLHAAAVEIDGAAVLFGAPRTFGKTTLAAAFVNAGYRLLNEDVTCLRLTTDPVVFPGPAMLRVRRDVAERMEIRNVIEVGAPDDRAHFALAQTARGDGTPLPVGAVVLLREDEAFRLEPVASTDALRDLWSLTFGLPRDQDRARAFTGLVELARSVPMFNFYRPRRIDDLPNTVEYLVAAL